MTASRPKLLVVFLALGLALPIVAPAAQPTRTLSRTTSRTSRAVGRKLVRAVVLREFVTEKQIAYHATRAIFDIFDDERVGGNTHRGPGASAGKFSLDSYLGHFFFPDFEELRDYPNRKKLLGPFMVKANLNLGKVAEISIRDLHDHIDSPRKASILREELLHQGFGGIHLVGGRKGKALTRNTWVALSSDSVRIRSIKNLKTGTELKAKNGPFAQQLRALRRNKPASAAPIN